MKTKIVLAMLVSVLIFSSAVMGQAPDKPLKSFVAASFINTSFAGKWAMEGGAYGGLFLNDHLYIGGGGFGTSQEKGDYEYDYGYGGLMLGYVWGDMKTNTLNFNLLGGAGGIEEQSMENHQIDDGFWVIRLSSEVDFRICDQFRIGIGGGYRCMLGVDLPSLNNSNVSAPFGSITLKFTPSRKSS